jgi:hypothetical protein
MLAACGELLAATHVFPLRPAKAWVAGPSPGFMALGRRGKARSPGTAMTKRKLSRDFC